MPLPVASGLLGQAPPIPVPPSLRQTLLDLLQQFTGSPTQIAVYLGLALLVLVIAYWLASKPVGDDRSTLGNALWVLFLYAIVLVIGGGLGVASAIMIQMALATFNSGHSIGPLVTMIGFGILSLLIFIFTLYCLFFIPIRVYRTTLGGAIVFLLLADVLCGAGWWGLNAALGHPVTPKAPLVIHWQNLNPTEEIKPLFTKQPTPYELAEQRASDHAKTIADRQTALKEMYEHLKSEREALPPGDADALAAYEKRRARYEQLLNELRAEVAAHRGSEV